MARPTPSDDETRSIGLFGITWHLQNLLALATIAEMTSGSTLTYDSFDDLRETVGRLVEDGDELGALQTAAREDAEAFTVEKQRERFEELVADVRSRGGGPGPS